MPSEVIAAFLWAQIENIEDIQNKRKLLWDAYFKGFKAINSPSFNLPLVPNYGTNNAHMFYVVCKDIAHRTLVINALKNDNFHAVFHYLSLHSSDFYKDKHDGRVLPNSDIYSDRLVRLPMYYELDFKSIEKIISIVKTLS